MAEAAPGPLVGVGRAADVYDIGHGRVLRRYRRSTSSSDGLELEATVMRHVADHGYPVPEVFDASGRDLVMERLDGVTMLADLRSRPWCVHRHADELVALHDRLAGIPVGDLPTRGIPIRFGPPSAILHLDFHPDNVILTERGAVVIHWTNSALGPAPADVAVTWVVSLSSTVDGPWWMRLAGDALRRRFVDRFVDGCGRRAATEQMAAAGEYRLADRATRPEEAVRVRRLVARCG